MEIQKKLFIEQDELFIDEKIGGNIIQGIGHESLRYSQPYPREEIIQKIITSWIDSFSYKEENTQIGIPGLRIPQIGSLHAIHAHWSLASDTASVVLPTGVGKTETMLSTMITGRMNRLLIIVPHDELRSQLFKKFLTLGVLKEINVVSDKAIPPIVGMLKHFPKTEKEMDKFLKLSQVIITTMKIAAESDVKIQRKLRNWASFLFIDEAHHLGAKSWSNFFDLFESGDPIKKTKILLFTATPYRNDGKPIPGKIIYNYPLKKAQEYGYFRPIAFKPINVFNPHNSDKAIVKAAISQLKEDLSNGFQHVVMARVNSVARANEIYELYKEYKEYEPVQIHTGISPQLRKENRNKIINGESKILICVDMFGEGFDLPQLKIAAFHDINKSFPKIIQIAGRFTRTDKKLGNATFIANIAYPDVEEELKKLYTFDADWNLLLQRGSDSYIKKQKTLWELINKFDEFSNDIPLQNIMIKTSAVVYKTQCSDWNPSNYLEGFYNKNEYEWIKHGINIENSILIIVTAKKIPIEWIKYKDYYQLEVELFVIYWNKQTNLLFIHNSENDGYFRPLATAITDKASYLINGDSVFRIFSDINLLQFNNIGRNRTISGSISYEKSLGPDVSMALSSIQNQNGIKNDMFGRGYKNGKYIGVGCTKKGRIWSRQASNLIEFKEWCDEFGAKILDDRIDPNEIMGNLLPVNYIGDRPNIVPVAVEWPRFLENKYYNGGSVEFKNNQNVLMLENLELSIKFPSEQGEIKFSVGGDDFSSEYSFNLYSDSEKPRYIVKNLDKTDELKIKIREGYITFTDYLNENAPVIWFADGSFLEGTAYINPRLVDISFDESNIDFWNWSDIDITKESQGKGKNKFSIQNYVIQKLMTEFDYDIVFDDDGSGEAADVVAIKDLNDHIQVDFFHCKWSSSQKPGRRVGDLYEVCGQAQKSIQWSQNIEYLLTHLMKRYEKSKDEHGFNRLEKGEMINLIALRDRARLVSTRMKVYIVQPGMNKGLSPQQRELLAATENHLQERYQIPFGVIGNLG